MSEKTPVRIELYRQAVELQRIGNRAVRAAQAESRRLGVPNVYSRDGVLYFELPNGEITRKNPFAEESASDPIVRPGA
jgi:hypothetical protein